jgi:hypothetical protein
MWVLAVMMTVLVSMSMSLLLKSAGGGRRSGCGS